MPGPPDEFEDLLRRKLAGKKPGTARALKAYYRKADFDRAKADLEGWLAKLTPKR